MLQLYCILLCIGAVAGEDTLRAAAAARGIYMGTAINHGVLTAGGSDAEQYRQVFAKEYNLATAENSCKFAETEPAEGNFTLSDCGYLLNVTQQENGVFRAHNLIWGNGNPAWLINGSFTPNQLRAVLREHIGNMTTRIGNNAYCWDVVNEAVTNADNNGTFKNVDPWYPAVPDYVDLAFHTARELAPPGVKLFYNDYGAEGLQAKSDRVYNMVKDMKARGIPVDGVGLQMHVSVDSHPPFADISANIARLGALGLEVHITEMDVKCSNCTQARLKKQAAVYAGVLKACLANAGVCKSFETWGFTDKHSWINAKGEGNLSPLPFDVNYNKKPAYTALLAALQDKNSHSSL